MSNVNVYLPDELAEQARAAGLNVSRLTQAAVRSALAAGQLDTWLDSLQGSEGPPVSHEEVLAAVLAAKSDIEGED